MSTDTNFDDFDDEETAQLAAAAFSCSYCLAGFAPAGTHPNLGEVYTACPACTEACPCCTGQALFPANTTCMSCLNEALAELGLTATFCHTCTGLLDLHPTQPPEVNP